MVLQVSCRLLFRFKPLPVTWGFSPFFASPALLKRTGGWWRVGNFGCSMVGFRWIQDQQPLAILSTTRHSLEISRHSLHDPFHRRNGSQIVRRFRALPT